MSLCNLYKEPVPSLLCRLLAHVLKKTDWCGGGGDQVNAEEDVKLGTGQKCGNRAFLGENKGPFSFCRLSFFSRSLFLVLVQVSEDFFLHLSILDGLGTGSRPFCPLEDSCLPSGGRGLCYLLEDWRGVFTSSDSRWGR